MSKCKKQLFAPKRCKGRTPGWHERKKKHLRFLKSEHKRLKTDLADKLKVVRAAWENHYAWITFAGSDVEVKYYCNYNYLRNQLRCQLFYKPAPFIIISQFYFFKIERTEEGDFMTGDGKLKEKLTGKDQNEIARLARYLTSSERYKAIMKLSK